jgi:rare lipoprotein A
MTKLRTERGGKLLLLLIACAGLATACDSQPQGAAAKTEKESTPESLGSMTKPAAPPEAAAPAEPTFEDQPVSSKEGTATWYDVPDGSLPERRAPGEMTAAHDKLPLGQYVRVTNLRNDKSVVVRITDDGIRGKSDIDLSKEAAESIDIVERGVAKVRIEVLKERSKP